ncbi:hypothetical protein CLV58_14119 [Spirosoma oryzae]|uniref:Uncharacterized protein n=1 Tax=Spirosoma oryzae TaxID=1469603 RepID=A0A2T0RQQ1_9BACT|nr:hypothetical protein CLV58_14119 [Spirosoma oryzae]
MYHSFSISHESIFFFITDQKSNESKKMLTRNEGMEKIMKKLGYINKSFP